MTFQECEMCAAKPGSPELCPSCLANRTAIEFHAKGVKVPAWVAVNCPYYAEMLDAVPAWVTPRCPHYAEGPPKYGTTMKVDGDNGKTIVVSKKDDTFEVFATETFCGTPRVATRIDREAATFLRDWLEDQLR